MFTSAGYTLMFGAAAAGIAGHEQGIASGMASTVQQVGGAVGLAVLVGIAGLGEHTAPADPGNDEDPVRS